MATVCGRCRRAADVTTCVCRDHTKRYGALCINCRIKLHPGMARQVARRVDQQAAKYDPYAADAEREAQLARHEDVSADSDMRETVQEDLDLEYKQWFENAVGGTTERR